MTTKQILIQKSCMHVALFVFIGLFPACNDGKTDSKSFEFLGEAIDRPENFDKDTIVTPENIDSLYRQYNVEAIFNGDYYLIRSKQSYTTSRYLSRLIQMKNGKQVVAKTFYDSEIDANMILRLKNKIIIGLNSLRENNYDSTLHVSTHKCRIIVLSDSLTPIAGKRFYSQKGHTYIESLMQNSDSTFFCSVASGDVEISPNARYQFRACYNLNIVRQTSITTLSEYDIKNEEVDFSKPNWSNDLSDEEIAIARNKTIPEQSDTTKKKADSFDPIPTKEEPPVIKKESNNVIKKEKKVIKNVAHQKPVAKSLTRKERFDNAKRVNDWNSMRSLADEGYPPAYLPLAKHYMKNPQQHGLAKKYAEKAKRAGVAGAIDIINELLILDY